MKKLKIYEAFSDEVYIHPKLSNFNKEDMQDFYDEFQLIAQSFSLEETKEIDPEKEKNHYSIGVQRNAYIELVLFKDSEEIIEELKSFITRMKQFGWILPNPRTSFYIENYEEYKEVTICFTKKSLSEMKHIKIFENFSEDEFTKWENVQGLLDVYQLYELLIFKYGDIFENTKQSIDEYEDDYNPDHIYEIIEMELKEKNLWEDFINNYETYQNDKEEADPFHWKHRKKIQDEFMKSFGDSLKENKIENIHHLIDGHKYKLTHPCYDDYDEGLEPEVEEVEVIKKTQYGFIFKNVEHGFTYQMPFSILMECEIEEITKL